ncbi:MAG: hypothetical protein WC271_11765 [Bacteroidales bacterium]|jgi:Na+-transporting methylmalonyl-CoA/oxaloacetate decarboxylase gamma subunit
MMRYIPNFGEIYLLVLAIALILLLMNIQKISRVIASLFIKEEVEADEVKSESE